MEEKSIYFICLFGLGTKALGCKDSLCVYIHIQEFPHAEKHASSKMYISLFDVDLCLIFY